MQSAEFLALFHHVVNSFLSLCFVLWGRVVLLYNRAIHTSRFQQTSRNKVARSIITSIEISFSKTGKGDQTLKQEVLSLLSSGHSKVGKLRIVNLIQIFHWNWLVHIPPLWASTIPRIHFRGTFLITDFEIQQGVEYNIYIYGFGYVPYPRISSI